MTAAAHLVHVAFSCCEGASPTRYPDAIALAWIVQGGSDLEASNMTWPVASTWEVAAQGSLVGGNGSAATAMTDDRCLPFPSGSSLRHEGSVALEGRLVFYHGGPAPVARGKTPFHLSETVTACIVGEDAPQAKLSVSARPPLNPICHRSSCSTPNPRGKREGVLDARACFPRTGPLSCSDRRC